MPELPEVENLRIGLSRAILGQEIIGIKVYKPKLVSDKSTKRVASKSKQDEFTKGLKGENFTAIERRAKNLIFKLTHDKIILVHLKMSGQFVYIPNIPDRKKEISGGPARSAYSTAVAGGHPIELSETKLPNKHSHVIFHLKNGTLYYNDTRMFGYLLYYKNKTEFEKQNHFTLLGVEPFSNQFTLKYFKDELKKKKGHAKGRAGKIKAVLMDQKIVTGLGNIYADESLFEARIRPDRNPSSLSSPEIEKLYKAILRILKQAVKVGGSSVATYRLLDDTRGNYAREHKVYGKAGKLCVKCKNPLEKTIIQSRTTVFCPNCQK